MKNDWLFTGKRELLLTPVSNSENNIAYVNSPGNILGRGKSMKTDPVRPVVYLNTDIKRVGGSGTSNDPFIIE